MKLLIFRRKNFKIIYLSLLILFIIISISTFSGSDIILDLDDDTNLSSWIESVEFSQQDVKPDYWTSTEFTIDLEIRNPGPFRISFQSLTGAIGFPYAITQSGNSSHILESYTIMRNDGGTMMASPTTISPGINHYQWEGVLWFNCTFSDSNPYLPDGNYNFIFGNDQWIERHQYDINVSSGILSHFPSEKPISWKDTAINLGNPYWYLIGLPFIILIIMEWRTNVKEGLPTKQNEEGY